VTNLTRASKGLFSRSPHECFESLEEIRRTVSPLTAKRDTRKDEFAKVVDVLTQLTREICFAGDRTEADQKVSKLLSLAA
jgi:hypothetical protein